MASTTLIFVPGAWHTAFHVKPLTAFITRYGYELVPVELETSKGTQVTSDKNVAPILRAIQSEIDKGRRVCVLGHSAAGLSTVASIHQFLQDATPIQKAQLVGVIFLAAIVIDPFRSAAESDWADVNFEKMQATMKLPAGQVFYNDMTTENARPYVDALAFSWFSMPDERRKEWWQEIKSNVKGLHYFKCERDNALLPKFQDMEIEDMGIPSVVLDAGHCPMVSQPEILAHEIHKLLA